MNKAGGDAQIPEGYTVSYDSDAADFRFYVMALAAIVSLAAFVFSGNALAIVFFALTAVAAFYFYPLSEKGKPRLGAGEYGIFVDGFGIIDWRAVADIDLYETAVRTIIIKELRIKLRGPLSNALIADWRLASIPRMFMRLPWKLTKDNMLIINMEPFKAKPDDVHQRLVQLRRYFGHLPRRRADK